MSNGRVGVYFNDATKAICFGNEFHYIHRSGKQKVERVEAVSFQRPPERLAKKAKLLEKFNEYLGKLPLQKNSEVIYVKKWLTTAHAVIFRLNNKTMQVFFNDNTELFVGASKKHVTFIDKGANCYMVPLGEVSETEHAKVFKRLQYVKDALTGMVVSSPKKFAWKI